MKKLSVLENLTRDGVLESPKTWPFPLDSTALQRIEARTFRGGIVNLIYQPRRVETPAA